MELVEGLKDCPSSSFTTLVESARFERISAARRSMAPSICFPVADSVRDVESAVLDVLHRGVDPDLVAEVGVTAPDDVVSIAEVREALDSGRVER